MGNAPPRNSYKVDPDYTSTGSTESLPSPRCYRYNLTQGKSQGQYVTPTMTMKISCENLQHICCSPDGSVWVCRRPQIIQLNSKGQHQLVLEVKIEICGLAASNRGSLVFTDGKNKRLICTQFEDDVITKKVLSTDDWYPIGVCCAENGDIIVGLFKPEEQGRVSRYSVTGGTRNVIQQDSSGGQLYKFPAFVTENGNGDVVVSDHLRRAVIVVDRWGRYRFTYTAEKLNRPDAVPFLPFGVCCDSLLNIIVSDCCNDCVHLISVNGEFLHLLFDKTSGLYRPVALSMSPDQKLYVGDRNGINVFNLDSQKPSDEDGKGSRTNSFSSIGHTRISNDSEKLHKLQIFQEMCKSKSSSSLKLKTTGGNIHNYNFGVGTPSSVSKTMTLSSLPRKRPNISVSPTASRIKASTLPRSTALLSKSVTNLNTIGTINKPDIVKPLSSSKSSFGSMASLNALNSPKHSIAFKDKSKTLMSNPSLVSMSPKVSKAESKLNSATPLRGSNKTTSPEFSKKTTMESMSSFSNKPTPAKRSVDSSSNKHPTSPHISKATPTSNADANKPVASKTTTKPKMNVSSKSKVTEKNLKLKDGVSSVDSAQEVLESSKTQDNNFSSKNVIREESRKGQEPNPLQTNPVEFTSKSLEMSEKIANKETKSKIKDPSQSHSCTEIDKKIPLKVSAEGNLSTKSSSSDKKKFRDSNILESTRI